MSASLLLQGVNVRSVASDDSTSLESVATMTQLDKDSLARRTRINVNKILWL